MSEFIVSIYLVIGTVFFISCVVVAVLIFNIIKINKNIKRILLEIEMLKGHERSIANYISHLKKSGDVIFGPQYGEKKTGKTSV